MHASHISFYRRYVKLLENELRKPDNHLISEVVIHPKEILNVCCDLPIWGLLCHDRKDMVYIIAPNNNLISQYNSYITKLLDIISNNNTISMTILTDPETNMISMLYFQ
jgi:hypothetical protein